ncbi:[FeFe] hydrogenase, group A [Peptococcaceae bacterium]|nr:[FeFe] hydrogenase, group A [Peptococcaceae bacterium]
MNTNDKEKDKKALTRRQFLKLMAAAGITGGTISLTGCQHFDKAVVGDGWIPEQYQVKHKWPAKVRGRIPIHPESLSLDRDDEKCILCGQCIQACRDIQSVYGYYELPIVDDVICIDCGQCVMWCPTHSLIEKDDTQKVWEALNDPDKFVVAQTAPATRVALGEEFGLSPGEWVQGQQVAALKKLGFDKVFDTNTGADFTIIVEESAEFFKILKGEKDKKLPLVTSCCPAWYKFCEYWYPDLLDHISSAGTPMQMLSSLTKTYYAKVNNIDPEKIFMVAIMPCIAKKYEIMDIGMNTSGKYWGKEHIRDTDAVLTVRELAKMLKEAKIDITALEPQNYDPILGLSSGAGLIFGATGGVAEACSRTAHFVITGKKAPAKFFNWTEIRDMERIKVGTAEIKKFGTMHVAVVHGLAHARVILENMRKGDADEMAPYHLVEVMACPGGCIGGGGMPRSTLPPTDEMIKKRKETIYKQDASMELRECHENPELIAVYENFLEYPLSPLAYELLHPHRANSRAHNLKAISYLRKDY